MMYALGTTAYPTEDYSGSIPKGKEAKTYYVWYMVKADPGYADNTPKKYVTVTIKEKPSPKPTPPSPAKPVQSLKRLL